MKPEEVIAELGLTPHPEGGHYKEVWRSNLLVSHPEIPADEDPNRAAATQIYFFLQRGEFSAWHVVKSDEVWLHFNGGPLELHQISPEGVYSVTRLGQDLTNGERPIAVVERGHYQAAIPADGAEWALGGCAVAPGFDFKDFSMPNRAELTDVFPHLAEVIRRFTYG